MVSAVISRLVILVFGTLYPAYASFKAIKTKNVKEYVKWMMYWIVFALFTCIETLSDILVSFWLPFYYELKILFVLWLLSPATKGSSILYRKFVHPQFMKREQEIDEYIATARDRGYASLVQLSSKGLSYATAVLFQTALRGQMTIVNHVRKSYSMTALDQQFSSDEVPYSGGQNDAVDSGLEDQHRWQSDGALLSSEDRPMDFQETATERNHTQNYEESSSETDEIGQTRKETKRVPRKVRVSTRQVTEETRKDVSAYATLPRSRAKTTRKKGTKHV
ncbi:receptor expression-enhancing protein 1-like [Limulus polyphemus]|uniref:Receptor expression-enhancing protein n=1 Tax=Limulus polyphemus TaxID=6850 RepID=A0ABM1BRV2_LIMPO|nr:receptor expression-enhancing protein 1-like [Limulus polyphemus]